jgi:hypothetical protein
MSTTTRPNRPAMTIRRALVAVLLVGATAQLASARALVSIDTCGRFIGKSQVAVLMADLDCTGSAYGVFLDNAALRMNGHAIVGGTDAGVVCKGSCKVSGPGSVSQAHVGIAAFPDTARGRTVQVAGVALNDNGYGLNVSEPLPTNHLKILLSAVTANDNTADGIACAAARVRGKDVTTNGNAFVGLRAGNLTLLRRFTAVGNRLGYDNLGDAPSILRDSTITGSTDGVDVVTGRFPFLVHTTCEHSLGPLLVPWGVCSGD